MAHHKSAQKRIRQSAKRRLSNRYYAKTMRNAIKEFRDNEDVKTAKESISEVISRIDKLAKKGVIHKKKAANLKSGLMLKLNAMTS